MTLGCVADPKKTSKLLAAKHTCIYPMFPNGDEVDLILLMQNDHTSPDFQVAGFFPLQFCFSIKPTLLLHNNWNVHSL